jgi:hypothetical protein
MFMTHDISQAAVAYVRRGWSVVALHDVSAGACSCGSADPEHIRKQGGKHPLYQGWQNAGPWVDRYGVTREPTLIRTEAAAADQWARRPSANVGLATGRVSGFWVLDVDPDNGGHVALAGLISAYGALPETYTVTTGSGGAHYYWALPDWEPDGSRGRLPIGLDIRGAGGQVVAPPSVSSKGPYAVAVDVTPTAAPAWLLDMIRPVRAEPGYQPVTKLEDSPTAGGLDRGAAYARSAVGSLLTELCNAQPGTRNETAFRVAVRLAELVNAPWSGLDGARVADEYFAACSMIDGGTGTFPQSEAADVLGKAVRRANGRPADLPAAAMYGTHLDWSAPVLPPGLQDFSAAGQGPAPVLAVGGPPPTGGYDAGQVAADPLLPYVEQAAVRLEIQRRARELIEARRNAAARVDFRGRLVSAAELAARPRAVSLVDGWLDLNTLARVYGASNAGKSFVVLDLASCVADGSPWHGRATRATRVVYGLAEAVDGMGGRVAAWAERHGRWPAVSFLPHAVQIGGPEWGWFVEDMATEQAGLIIFDTQAKSTVGVKENDNTEIGIIMGHLDDLRRATGACVLLVHHKGSVGDQARGGTAGKAAMDDEIDVSRIGTRVRVRSGKPRDRVAPDAVELDLVPLGPSAVLVGDGEGRATAGPFVSPVNGSGGRSAMQFAARVLALVEILLDNYAEGNGGTEADIRALYYAHREVVELEGPAKRKAFRRAWNRLEELGRLAKVRGLNRFKFVELDDLGPLEANPDKLVPEGWILAEASTSRKRTSPADVEDSESD